MKLVTSKTTKGQKHFYL